MNIGCCINLIVAVSTLLKPYRAPWLLLVRSFALPPTRSVHRRISHVLDDDRITHLIV